MAAALGNPKRTLHRATSLMCAKSGSYETALARPTVTAGKEAAYSFMESVSAVHTVTRAAVVISDTIVKNDSNDTEHKWQPPSRTVVESLLEITSEKDHVLAYLSVMTKADIEVIAKCCLTKWTHTFQPQAMRDVEIFNP